MYSATQIQGKSISLNAVVFLLLLLSLASCNKSKETSLIKKLEESISSSTRLIETQNEILKSKLNEKMNDSRFQRPIEIWKPKADTVNMITERIVELIDSSKNNFASAKKQAYLGQVYDKLILLSNVAQGLDLGINSFFKEHFLSKYKCLIDNNQKKFISEIESLKAKEEYHAGLTKLRNDIRVFENFVLNFCNNMSSYLHLYHDYFGHSIFTTQNTTHLKAGEILEIKTGVGSFSLTKKPKVIIDGNFGRLNEDGVVIYKVVAPNKLGKHSIPINFSYLDRDGINQTYKFDVIYYVD